MITLSLLHPVNKTPVQHWTFEADAVIRIGRSMDNDVVLYSAVVSRHHVELRQTGQGWTIMSLGTNGTYLEDQRIEQIPVEDGIIIRLARSGPNIQISLTQQNPEISAAQDAPATQRPSAKTTAEHTPGFNQPSFVGSCQEEKMSSQA